MVSKGSPTLRMNAAQMPIFLMKTSKSEPPWSDMVVRGECGEERVTLWQTVEGRPARSKNTER